MVKVGRNEPCPCGSGKKYKKCCLAKDEEATGASPIPQDAEPAEREPRLGRRTPPPPDPLEEQRNEWRERFEQEGYEGTAALFGQAMHEPGVMDGEMAFDILSDFFDECARRSEREQFDALVAQLRAELPQVYEEESEYLVEWMLENALVSGNRDALAAHVSELAAMAPANPHRFRIAMDRLAFHGYGRLLATLATAVWRAVGEDDELSEQRDLAVRCARHAALDLVDRSESDKVPPQLSEVIAPFEEVDLGTIQGYVTHLTRGERLSVDPADLRGADPTATLTLLGAEFVGHVRREEQVPYCLGELAGRTLTAYLTERLTRASSPRRRPSRKRPKSTEAREFPQLLCPEPNSFDRFIAGFFQIPFVFEPYPAVAVLELLPAWLRFLEGRGLLDVAGQKRAETDLRSIVDNVRTLVGSDVADPALAKALAQWPRPAPAATRVAPGMDRDVAWSISLPAPSPRPGAMAIDWQRATAGDIPSHDFLAELNLEEPADLDQAVEAFLAWLQDGLFLQWEAVMREEQGLRLTRRQRGALSELLDFNDEDAEDNERILHIDEMPRPTQPWYEILRCMAPRLAVELPLRTAEIHYDSMTEAWPRLVEALDKDARDLSLPEGVTSAIEVLPAELRHRLWLQTCCDALLGLGQRDIPSLAHPDAAYRVNGFINSLRQHRDSVKSLGLTLRTLPRFVELPAEQQEILSRRLAEELHLASPDVSLAEAL